MDGLAERWIRSAAAMALVLSLAAACAGCGRSDALPEETQWSTSDGAEDAAQIRLGAIDPSAYGDVESLDLEAGTKISVIMKASGDESYWKQVKAGAKQAQDEINESLGYTGDDQVEVQVSGPTTAEDAEDQINLLDEELDANPSAIVISLIDADACEMQFDLAAENGIPIITMDSGSAYSGISTTCSTDNTSAGKRAAKELCKMIGDEGEIALIVHDSISETAKLREKAFRKEIKKNHPDVTIVDTIHLNELDLYKQAMAAEQNGDIDVLESASGAEEIDWTQILADETQDDGEDTEDGTQADTDDSSAEEESEVFPEDISDAEVLTWMLGKHPNLVGLFTSNDNSAEYMASDTADAEAIQALSVVSFDAGTAQLENLDSGLVDGLIVQNPYGMGYASVVAAARTILGLGNESVIDTGYVWATKDTLSDTEIKAMLYE